MTAVYWNHLSGVVDDNPLTLADTTLNSTGLIYMPAITAPDFMWLVLDPHGTAGAPEIVKVTAHTASATSCTIVRGQQTGTGGWGARQHNQNTVWANAQTVSDFTDIIALSTALDARVDVLEATEVTYDGRLDALEAMNPGTATVATSQSTSSTSYTDLATSGPAVTMTTGTLVRITISSLVTTGADSLDSGHVAVAISGATTAAAPAGIGNTVLSISFAPAGQSHVVSFIAAVTAGSNTFTAKYYKGPGPGATATFANRYLIVERLN